MEDVSLQIASASSIFPLPELVPLSASGQRPTLHPRHLSVSGTPFKAEFMWRPHPVHVVFLQVGQVQGRHILANNGMSTAECDQGECVCVRSQNQKLN